MSYMWVGEGNKEPYSLQLFSTRDAWEGEGGGYAVESCRKALLINSKFINILDELQCRLEEKEFELMVVEARQI